MSGSSTNPNPLHFDPSPDLAAATIQALHDPDRSLRDVASEFNTTIEALTAWMNRDDIRERIAAIDSAACLRARFLANSLLRGVVKAAARMIDEYQNEEHRLPVDPSNYKELEQRRRSRETTRKAMFLLLRLSSIYPAPAPPDPVAIHAAAVRQLLRRHARRRANPAPQAQASGAQGVRFADLLDNLPDLDSILDEPQPAPSTAPAAPAPAPAPPPAHPQPPAASLPSPDERSRETPAAVQGHTKPGAAPVPTPSLGAPHATLHAFFSGLRTASPSQVAILLRSILAPKVSVHGGHFPVYPDRDPFLRHLFHNATSADIAPYSGPVYDPTPASRFVVTLHSNALGRNTALLTLRPSAKDPAIWQIADIAEHHHLRETG